VDISEGDSCEGFVAGKMSPKGIKPAERNLIEGNGELMNEISNRLVLSLEYSLVIRIREYTPS